MVDTMNREPVWIWTVVLIFSFSSVWAQDEVAGDEAETTIRLMGAAEAALPEAVTREIALPESLPEDAAAVEKAQTGIETANAKRRQREERLSTNDAARENSADMADEAQKNRETRGRSEDHIPQGTPNGPDNPGPPGG
jgi:hypothetical protein